MRNDYEVHNFRALILLSSTRVCGVTQEGPGDQLIKLQLAGHRTAPAPSLEITTLAAIVENTDPCHN